MQHKAEGKGRSICETCKSRNYAKKNPVKVAFLNVRGSAKKRGHGFEITWEEFKAWSKTKDGKKYMKYKGQGGDDMTLHRPDEEGPYNVKTMQLRYRRDNTKEYWDYWRAKDKKRQEEMMSDLPF